MRKHYPICECVPGIEWAWIDDDNQQPGHFDDGIYDARCKKCRLFFWWELANDESMQALAEMNAQ